MTSLRLTWIMSCAKFKSSKDGLPLHKHAHAIHRDIYAQNIDCIPLNTPVLLYKSGGLQGYTFQGHVPLILGVGLWL